MKLFNKSIYYVSLILVISLLPMFLYSDDVPLGVKVTKVYGKAFYQKPGEESWQELQSDKTIGYDYQMRTEADSYVEFQMSAGNEFRLKENSKVKINELSKAEGVVKKTKFDLLGGEILAKLDNLPPDTLMQVSSPTAVAGARGTGFLVRYNHSNSATSISVVSHRISVQSIGESQKNIMVDVNREVTVTPWKMAKLSVRGSGILSEAILGETFIKQAKSPVLKATGEGATKEKAKESALVSLSRKVLGIAIDADTTVADIIDVDNNALKELYAYMVGAKEASSRVTEIGEIEITLLLDMNGVSNIIKRQLPNMPEVIERISLKEYGEKFGAKARVTTQRAAQLDGYRKLAEAIYGTVIDSSTTMKDYIVKDDRIVNTVKGVVKGAEIIETQYFSDGSMSLTMIIRADLVKGEVAKIIGDVFGTNYFTSPKRISIDDYMKGKW